MFGIPLPYLLLALSIALFGTYRGGYHFGWSDRDAEMQIEIANKNGVARELEKNMTSKLAEKETELRKAQDEISKKQSDAYKLVDTGKLRLPVQTTSCVQPTPDATPAPRDRDEARPDPYREAIKAIVAIAIEGDRNTLQLNSCIDSYNEVREKINGKR